MPSSGVSKHCILMEVAMHKGQCLQHDHLGQIQSVTSPQNSIRYKIRSNIPCLITGSEARIKSLISLISLSIYFFILSYNSQNRHLMLFTRSCKYSHVVEPCLRHFMSEEFLSNFCSQCQACGGVD